MLRGLFSRIDLMVRLLVLAILLASFLPAWNAARLTVRDTLAYQ